MAPKVPNVKLNSGYDMPQVGFGLWKVDNPLAPDTVYKAIKAGFRLFDGACDYGNETECGQGVARAIKEGLVKRSDLFIVSKLWNSFHEGDRVEPICRKQLADWGVDYFDLYIMHFPVALAYVDPSVRYPPGWHYDDAATEIRTAKVPIQETWQAMERLVDAGLARSIGVSNCQSQTVYDILRYARIPPATLQVEHHPYNVQPELIRLAKAEGIQVTAYSSFGPASFLDFDMKSARETVPLLREPTINAVAKKYGRPAAQVLLRWSTQRGLAVIPKTLEVSEMLENLDHTSFDMSQEDLDLISSLDKKTRFNQPVNYFPTEKLWIFG
ncbi:NAD(P)H-dependent D-xylose reductase XYR1 [Pleurostoma richardsiae]|uniref:NAD(P)H-dependent D-xylose reductase XYR1 n=1 Tax=Pleurostoma richardsiae TaxID=41990 RepID=A0AA38VBE4_9PEZI|nr:NAD(P)H-dependent D-xylose reductase XYR1 [Pleurostoma richardsiae]